MALELFIHPNPSYLVGIIVEPVLELKFCYDYARETRKYVLRLRINRCGFMPTGYSYKLLESRRSFERNICCRFTRIKLVLQGTRTTRFFRMKGFITFAYTIVTKL